ncbi:MAG: hypothetical protein ACTSRS_03980 [Candidatus Helarchaeota archaeon]
MENDFSRKYREQRFLLRLLQQSTGKSKGHELIPINTLIDPVIQTHDEIHTQITHLNEHLGSVIQIEGLNLRIIPSKKILLIEAAIRAGVGLDEIITTLHWHEFEHFCLHVLNHHEFITTQNFHFSLDKKRWEIDVIGLRPPLLFALDAKQWKTGSGNALKTMVHHQITRVKALKTALHLPKISRKLCNNLQIRQLPPITLIPLLVTSKMYNIKLFEQVPIIPFFQLNQFLVDLPLYLEMILQFQFNTPRRSIPTIKKLSDFITS